MIKIRIDKCSSGRWYRGQIGSILNVEIYRYNDAFYQLASCGDNNSLYIDKIDCTILDQPLEIPDRHSWWRHKVSKVERPIQEINGKDRKPIKIGYALYTLKEFYEDYEAVK